MSKKIVVSLTPITDDLTLLGYQFKKYELLPIFQQHQNLITINIYGKEATVLNFKNIALNNDISYVSILGHGNNDNFFVRKSVPVKYLNENDLENELLEPLFQFDDKIKAKDKIFHLFACNTANRLGENLVKNGAKAFIGYNQLVGALYDKSYLDEIFLCDSEIDWALAEGKTVAEAHEAAYEAFVLTGDKYNDEGKFDSASDFYRQGNALCSPYTDEKYGDKDATIFDL